MNNLASAMLILGLAAATHTRVTAQDFSTSLEAHPTPQNSPQSAAIQQADEALATHNYGKAVSLLTPLVAANPKDAALAYDLAAGQDALDQTEPAEKNYRLAIGDDPALMAPRVALGLLFARQGNLLQHANSLPQRWRCPLRLPRHLPRRRLPPRYLLLHLPLTHCCVRAPSVHLPGSTRSSVPPTPATSCSPPLN
jgi:hypothetical protein